MQDLLNRLHKTRPTVLFGTIGLGLLFFALTFGIFIHLHDTRQNDPWTYRYAIDWSDNGAELTIGQSMKLQLVAGWDWTYHADGPLKQVSHNTFAGTYQDGLETITAHPRLPCTGRSCTIKFTVQVVSDEIMRICHNVSLPVGAPVPPCQLLPEPAGLVQIMKADGSVQTNG